MVRVFEYMVLKRIFGRKRDEVTGEWRKLHIEELNDLYSSPNIIRANKSRRMRWEGHVARMGEVYIGFWWGDLRERERERPFRRLRRRWEDNIKVDFQVVGCWGHGLADMEYGRVAGSCECGIELLGSMKCGNYFTSSGPVSLSRRTLLRGVS